MALSRRRRLGRSVGPMRSRAPEPRRFAVHHADLSRIFAVAYCVSAQKYPFLAMEAITLDEQHEMTRFVRDGRVPGPSRTLICSRS
jgi:hypothetical protein